MADVVQYKQYNQRQRRAVLETDFSKGMMSTEGAVEDGYLKSLVNCTYEKETAAIMPRPGLRVSTVVFPNDDFGIDHESLMWDDFMDPTVTVKYNKQCVENGVTYNQIILGKLDEEDPTKGLIWVLTSSAFLDQTELRLTEDYSAPVTFANSLAVAPMHCCYYTVESPFIHNIFLTKDEHRRIEFPVASFAYGNHFYFLGQDTVGGSKGLYRTFFDESLNPPRYNFQKVEPKELEVSEAVAYGYNMLLGNGAYVFNDGSTAQTPQLKGILPYASDGLSIMMTPKQNQPVLFRCYYDISTAQAYDVVWEWRETTSADWTQIQKGNVNFGNTPHLTCQFTPPAKDIMLRVVLYRTGSDEVIKAIVVGFDFTASNYGTAKQLEQKVYDLTTATGMESWKGRIVLWGVPEDPTILFLSDYEEPSYFPYPNNIIVFDEPVIYAIEFLDNLVVFTTDKIYQVTIADDGNSWNTSVLQSHLSIEPWDKHLIQVVRNMLYFKSGNYYYMMVPKAQSLTGELTLAPITNPITSFFDKFSVNVRDLLKYTYGYDGDCELITYYNFLDYEDMHNIYAYKFDDSYAILHFDVIYNTVDRTWKVWIYEAPNLLFPFKQEATRTGLLATTSSVTLHDATGVSPDSETRIIQLFSWDKMIVRSCYVPEGTALLYDPDAALVSTEGFVLHLKDCLATLRDHTLLFFSDLYAKIEDHVLRLQNADDFYYGYSKANILSSLQKVYQDADDYYTFRNFQFIDSGYRKDELQYKKRYREIQLQINNLDKVDMEFGMDYVLDGSPRKILYKYDVAQYIDEFEDEFGVVYIDSTPYLETEIKDIDRTNQWTIDQSLTPEVTLWKVRVSVSGKGYAPRIRLYSRNEKRYELLSINWVSKIMHMR